MAGSKGRHLNLVVVGDVVVDHHIYDGERVAAGHDDCRGVRDWREAGGAALLKETLSSILDNDECGNWHVHLGVQAPSLDEDACGHHAYALWTPSGKSHDADKEKVWRIKLAMGYGHVEQKEPIDCQPNAIEPAVNVPKPDILGLDDAGSDFRMLAQKECWLLPQLDAELPRWIVLKMSRPLARGDLWHELAARFADRLVCVVTADALRQESAGITRGLSWERTVEEVRDAVLHNPALMPLARCRHLIVGFSDDGALWLDHTDIARPSAKLIFDAAGAEGENAAKSDGGVFGYSVCMMAAVSGALARHITREPGADEDKDPDLAKAIAGGLAAQRNLFEVGHGPVGNDLPKGFPAKRVAETIANHSSGFAQASVPWPADGEDLPDNRQAWMIVEASQQPAELQACPPLIGLARQLVIKGKQALREVPHAKFGKLTSTDRFEIETLRNLRRLMTEYRSSNPGKKPLSVGVFGPPGAGKSFGVKQIAEEVFGVGAWIEFNLSQFADEKDLIGSFHQVRDQVLSGVTPVVFWDEFDSNEYGWLKYLLAPMQDGRFQEGQISHWIGKCVFVFAGGTSPSFREFLPANEEPLSDERRAVWHDFKLKKGPDFHSRLDAYYDVTGPNPRELLVADAGNRAHREVDPTDVCFPLRRALMIRSLVAGNSDARLDFDPGLLDALLLVPKYKHGARSLEKLVTPLRPAQGETIRRSALPAPDQLAMHVDAEAFLKILRRDEAFQNSQLIEQLAAAIHEFWRVQSKRDGWKMAHHLDKRYSDLAPIDQEDNRSAARRIPSVLSLVGLGLSPGKDYEASDGLTSDDVGIYLEFHLELLSEGEHDGWMDERQRNGWRLGVERNDEQRIHPLLVLYADLSEVEKNKDRNTVRHFPVMAELAGYRIVWLET